MDSPTPPIPGQCCLAVSTVCMEPRVRPARSIRCIPTAAITASFWIDGRREEMTMTRIAPAERRRSAVKVAAVMLAGGWLAGCKTTETADTVPYPYDYRQRHPITLQEGTRTVELFVGRRRSGLTPAQRSNGGALAQNWHHDATGGIEIRVPSGTGNARAARETVSEIQGILVAAGVPPGGIA